RPRHRLGHELSGECGNRAETALLPGADERPSRARVRHAGAGRDERETATGALPAAGNGPCGGRSTAATKRRQEMDERAPAGEAEDRTLPSTGGAPLGKDETEQPLRPRYGQTRAVSVSAPRQICDDSSAYS